MNFSEISLLRADDISDSTRPDLRVIVFLSLQIWTQHANRKALDAASLALPKPICSDK